MYISSWAWHLISILVTLLHCSPHTPTFLWVAQLSFVRHPELVDPIQVVVVVVDLLLCVCCASLKCCSKNVVMLLLGMQKEDLFVDEKLLLNTALLDGEASL